MIALVLPALVALSVALAGPNASTPGQPATARDDVRAEAVKVTSGEAVLAGTLYLPRGKGPHPAVVLIHGSGPQTRGWPYSIHAKDFAARGIAALVYDKRGTGQSTGTYSEAADFPQLAGDASAAVRFLASHPHIRRDRIGVWGRSQGAWIAPMVAAETKSVAFAILIVGGGVSVMDQNLYASRRRLESAGYTDDEIDVIVRAQGAMARYLASAEGRGEAESSFAAIRSNPRLTAAPNEILNRFTRVPPPEWVRANQNGVLMRLRESLFDPAAYLAQLSVPTLAILAGEDRLTPTDATARILNRVLSKRSDGSMIAIFPGADHTLCPAVAGKDYQPGCRFVSGYEQVMGNWLQRVVTAGN